jgi:hypothetical protein
VTLRVVRGIIGRAGQIGMLLVVGDMRVVIHGRVLPGTAPLVGLFRWYGRKLRWLRG